MISTKILLMLVFVEVLCGNKQLQQQNFEKTSEIRSEDAMEAIKAKLKERKRECTNDKEEVPVNMNRPDRNFHANPNPGRNTYRGYNYDRDYPNARSDYESDPYAVRIGYGVGYVRSKRDEDDADYDDKELDENQSPSEFALIKWVQDNTPQNEKRIKAIREIRRCFGQIAVADNGDGCNFSKSLLECLNLKIEE